MVLLTTTEGELILKAYEAGNSKNTIDYLRYLLAESKEQRLLIFWDGASYHRSKEIQDFLSEVNQDLPREEWKIPPCSFGSQLPYAKSD